MKNFISFADLGKENCLKVLKRAKEMKDTRYLSTLLKDKIIILIFEKASTRTRISFEVAIRELGGSTIFMTPNESQLGRSEPLKDTSRVLSRYAHGLVVRTFGQEKIDELIEYGSIPVVNALTDQGHPCQVMADVLTIYERNENLSEIKVAWVGDGNNMANSWIEASQYFGFELSLACPKGFEPDMNLFEKAKANGARLTLTDDPQEAVKGAHFVNTDVWASMGQEEEQKAREKAFEGYCVDSSLMSNAAENAYFMHCLPAHRGEEVSEEIFESPQSIVWDEAENRLHAQKAILEWIFDE